MNDKSMNLILASKSPRRKQLLEQAGYSITIKLKEIDESYPSDLETDKVAEFIAIKKADGAKEFLQNQEDILITSDTIVVWNDNILGKPKDKADAVRILKNLSGNKHTVITGVCLMSLEKKISFSDTSTVWFSKLTDEEIEFYLENYQPYDKAGSYGIQEWLGLCKIHKIEGTYANIMGLPVNKIYDALWGMCSDSE